MKNKIMETKFYTYKWRKLYFYNNKKIKYVKIITILTIDS